MFDPFCPLPPSKDPFYTAPRHFQAASPGNALRFRVAPGNLSSILANCSAAYNILYRTTDAANKPSWAVTTLLAPKTAIADSTHGSRNSGRALVSYQIPYDSAFVDASPSFLMYDPLQNTTLLDITAALGRGWFVNVPDYEGPLAAFGLGLQEGHATLDSVRAVLEVIKKVPLGLRPDTKYAIWGYSGGSIASEWAAELQSSYAPELRFAGVIAGGLVARFESTLKLVSSGSAFAGLVPSALLGLTAEFPHARQDLVSRLKKTGPYNATTFLDTLHMSFEQTIVTFLMQNISNYFVNGAADVFSPDILDLLNSQGVMGEHGVPRMPLFFYKAIADEVAPTPDTDALVDKYCRLGANILYERNKIGDHETELQNGHTRSLNWLSDIFGDGNSHNAHGCTVLNVSVVDPTGPVIA
ncbi:lipase [Rhizodiscina lignyota]|uniref:Lipase n=1 Tax=Rhizodiscina lignyota TaxID=1504668 RepID=A0A9P4IKW9_9PEZI|nr:lipase [Rhizodiscina lignyota]